MWSNPSYDPNMFVNEDFEVAQDVIVELQEDHPLGVSDDLRVEPLKIRGCMLRME